MTIRTQQTKAPMRMEMSSAEPGKLFCPWLWYFFAVFVCFVSSNCLAADKSAVGPSAISVPKGPGSIEGLGESFQPSLNTGTAKYGIGIKMPPGPGGHAPQLGLSYEGGG